MSSGQSERSVVTGRVAGVSGVRVSAASAGEGRRTGHTLRAHGVRTLAVRLTGGSELEVVVGGDLECWLVRAIQLAVGRAPVDRPADVFLETADGPVALLIPRRDPPSALPPSALHGTASALTHAQGGASPGGLDGRAHARRLELVTSDR
jgi:hypothetical protein